MDRARIDMQENWRDGKCPACNGIIFPTGQIVANALKWFDTTEDNVYQIRCVSSETETIDLNANSSDIDWTDISAFYEVRDYTKNLMIECGESSIDGAHGFVAVSNLRENEFRWIAYFCDSNPFRVCELHETSVIAESTLGIQLRFPIDSPEHVEVLSQIIKIE